MENAYIFRILILCVAALAELAHGEMVISVEVSKKEADLGDDIQVKCHIQNEDKATFYVVWVKRIDNHDVEIGTNQQMNQAFEDSARYSGSVQFKVANDISDVTFVLDIKAVEATDSGEIGCRVPKLKLSAFDELIVKVPFSSVVLSSGDVVYKSGDIIQFDEGETQEYTCKAHGGYPEPELTMSLGDEDITSRFEKTVTLIKDGIPGLYSLSYNIELKNPSLEITYEYSKKKMQCSASFPGMDVVNSTWVDIELTGYKPQFMCDEIIQLPLHKEDVNITCRVRADPPIQVNMTEYYWQRTSTDNDTILPGNSIGHYTAFLEHGIDEYEKVMTLHIDHIYTNHFQTYFFQASNKLGSVTHGVELRRIVTYEVDTDAPTGGSTDNKVPGKKDGPSSVASMNRLLPGIAFTALLMIVLL